MLAVIEKFIAEHDMKTLSLGKHIISDTDFVNVCEPTTTDVTSESVFEVHKQYIDVHYVITGEEKILVTESFDEMTHDYDEKDDYALYKCSQYETKILKEGDSLFVDTDIIHSGAHSVTAPMKIKKAIFKIYKPAE